MINILLSTKFAVVPYFFIFVQIIMNESQYELIIYWDNQDKIFVVDVPELPGCMAHGESKKAAIDNVENAIKFWIKTAKEDGIDIPVPKGRLMFA